MEPKKLNEVCCVFAGVEPTRRELCSCSYPKHEEGCDQPLEVIFPPVSTDWEAAGRLMDALREKQIWVRIVSYVTIPETPNIISSTPIFVVSVGKAHQPGNSGRADSGPMALALAVVELAKELAK